MEESDYHFKFEDAPLYKKAMQLSNLVDRLVEPIEIDDLTDTTENKRTKTKDRMPTLRKIKRVVSPTHLPIQKHYI